jgi:hypothetical protein
VHIYNINTTLASLRILFKGVAIARVEGEQSTYLNMERRKIKSLEYSFSLQMKYEVLLALFLLEVLNTLL